MRAIQASSYRSARPILNGLSVTDCFDDHPTGLEFEGGAVATETNVAVPLGSGLVDAWSRPFLEALAAAVYTTDAAGRITFYNEAAAALWGCRPELGQSEFCGSWKLYWPDGTPLAHAECPMAVALREARPVRGMEAVAERPDGTRVPFIAYPTPLFDAAGRLTGAVNMLADITEQKRAEQVLREQIRRFEALNAISKTISSDLDLERIVQTVTDTATELTGARFGAFFYNVMDASGESYTLYALSGAPREAFDKLGLPRNTAVFEPTFRGIGVVRSDDIRADPRYGKNEPHYGMPQGHLPVVSYLAVPVVSRSGEVHGGLFFGHDQPGAFLKEAEDIVSGIAAHAAIAVDNARLLKVAQASADSKKLLLDEIKHRVKNTLATVQAIAMQTLRSASPAEKSAYIGRLHALANAYDLLTSESWDRAPVRDVVSRALDAFEMRRFAAAGSDVWISANRSLQLTMALHELATNAVKYGALSNAVGKVHVQWEALADDRLKVVWRETGGRPWRPPRAKVSGRSSSSRRWKARFSSSLPRD